MASDDVEIGIDGSAAKRGANEVVAQLGRIEKAAGSVSSRAGKKLDTLFTKIQRLSGVQSVSSAKIQSIQNLASAIGVLGATRGPNKAMVANMAALFKALSAFRAPAGLSSLASAINAFSNFKGPSKVSVANLKSLFSALARLPGTAGLQKMLSDLRLITARLAPVASALTRLQGAGGAAANGLRRAGTAARSTHADFVGLRASSLSLGGALLRTGEFASALGAAFGLRTIATEINTLQKTEAGLMAVTGSLGQSRKEMEFLMQTARTYKVYVGDLSLGYSQFRVASEGLGLSLAETQQIFKDVTQGVRVFNLSTDDAEGVFRALTQIASKGSLQMEELRGQLGDRMPVAVQAMANALEVSTSKLGDMMKKGQVTGDVLKKGLIGFGAEIRKMTDAGLLRSTQTLGAALGDLKTTFYEFSNAAGNAGLTEFFQNVADGLNEMMRSGSAANTIMQSIASSLAFLSSHFHLLGLAIAALTIPKLLTFLGGMVTQMSAAIAATSLYTATTNAGTAATTANSAATATNATTKGGLIATLMALGAAQKVSTAATVAGTAAIGFQTAATQLLIGSLRALRIAFLANPLGWILIGVTALAGGFAWLGDKIDTAKQAQKNFAAATELASSEALSAQTSIEALADKYEGLARAADQAALAQSRANAIKGRADAVEADQKSRDSYRRLRSQGNETRWILPEVDFSNRYSVDAARGQINEHLAMLDTIRAEGGRLNSLQQYQHKELTDARTQLDAQIQATRARDGFIIEEKLADVTRDSLSRGENYAATRVRVQASASAMNNALGTNIAEKASPVGTITESSDGGKGKKDKEAEKAARELKRLQENAKRFTEAMDPAYASSERLKDAIEAIGYINEAAFGNSTVSKIEMYRRAINDAYPQFGEFDTIANVGAAWEDNERSLIGYRDALKKQNLYTDEAYVKTAALSRLKLTSTFGDSLGPVAKMASLVGETERKLDELAANSQALGLSDAVRASLAADIAEEYNKGAQELARSTRTGKLLVRQFEAAANALSDYGSALENALGTTAARGLLRDVEALNREFNRVPTTLKKLTAGAMTEVTSTVSAVVDGVSEIPVNMRRINGPEFHSAGVEMGGMLAEGIKQGVASQALDDQIFADMKKVEVFKTISDFVGQGGAVSELARYSEAIQQVKQSMTALDPSSQTFRQHAYLLHAMEEAAKGVTDAYYAAGLEASRMGGVMSRAVDGVADAIDDLVTNGTMDVGQMLRSVQADLIRTFVTNPAVSAIKTMLAKRMDVPDPSADPAQEGSAGSLMVQAAQMQSWSVQRFEAAQQAMQLLQNQEQVFLNSLQLRQEANTNQFGLHIATFANAISMMPGAGQALVPYSSPSGPTLPLGTTAGDAAGGQQGAGQGSIAGAVNATLQQPSQALGQSAQMLTNAAGQTITSALGLTGVAGQFAGMVIPQMISAVVSQIFGASATSGAAVATGAAATATGGAAAMLITAATMLMTAATIQMTTAMIPGFHSGGIAGGTPTFTRTMSASAFAGAPRYHAGGIAGFKPGEVPAVLKRKEEILTEDNPRHIANFYSERGVGPSGGTEVHQTSFSETNTYNIRIEGSGGTPEQNSDLAQKLGDVINKTIDNRTRRTMDKRSRAGGMKVK